MATTFTTPVRASVYPEGTEVGAYPVSNWPGSNVRKDAAPIGSATNEQTVTNGELAFTGLTDNTSYVMYALSGGESASVVIGEGDAALFYGAIEAGADGNDITVTYVDPAGASEALAVSVTGTDIEVSLETDGDE